MAGKDAPASANMRVIARQELLICHTTIEELLEPVFSMRSVPKLEGLCVVQKEEFAVTFCMCHVYI
jgi:hypothetical protein